MISKRVKWSYKF